MESDSDAESDAETRPKSLTELPADAVCQVLVALDDAYDIAQTASVCTLVNDAVKQAFVLKPHLAEVADLAKQVAQLELDNAELQKHTIVPADQERLFAKLHTLEQSVEAQTARADAAEARCSKLLRWVEEQKDRADEHKKELDAAEARCTKFSRELLNQQARAAKHKERAEKYKAQLPRQEAVENLRRRGLRTVPDYRLDRSAIRSTPRFRSSLPRSAPRLRSSLDEYDSDSSAPSTDIRPRRAPRRRARAD